MIQRRKALFYSRADVREYHCQTQTDIPHDRSSHQSSSFVLYGFTTNICLNPVYRYVVVYVDSCVMWIIGMYIVCCWNKLFVPVREYASSRKLLLDQAMESNSIGPTTVALLWIYKIPAQRTTVLSRCMFHNNPICFQIFLNET